MKTLNKLSLSFTVMFFLLPAGFTCHAQTLDVPYVPTPHAVVEAMLDVAEVGPSDYVIDLGSGDGRIVIAAAQRGASGHGVDLDPERISEAERNAAAAGVSDRVHFIAGDLFEADISKATVVTMYLLQHVNLSLQPVLFEQLKPGARIVSHAFSMGQWEPDAHIRPDNRDVYYWVIPADLGGRWEWTADGEDFVMDVRQEFQKLSVDLRNGNKRLQVENPVVVGERVSFVAEDPQNGNRYAYNARVDDNAITGSVQIRSSQNQRIENWNATLRSR
jgi:SAM-dependent methyltransferase